MELEPLAWTGWDGAGERNKRNYRRPEGDMEENKESTTRTIVTGVQRREQNLAGKSWGRLMSSSTMQRKLRSGLHQSGGNLHPAYGLSVWEGFLEKVSWMWCRK